MNPAMFKLLAVGAAAGAAAHYFFKTSVKTAVIIGVGAALLIGLTTKATN